jgi:hypothetical protein
MQDMKYLIVSMENDCVFTYSPRAITACALAEGDIDAVTVGITYAYTPAADYALIKNRDLFYGKAYIYDFKKYCLVETSFDNLSDSWKQTQEVVRLRQEAFFVWESLTANAALKATQNTWDGYDFVAYGELSKCSPVDDVYTQPIHEYARILEMSVSQAYKELKLQTETQIIKKFRIQSLSEKWKRRINSCYTKDEIDAAKKQMNREFITNGNL